MEQRTIGIIIGIIALVLVGAYAFFAIDKQSTQIGTENLPIYGSNDNEAVTQPMPAGDSNVPEAIVEYDSVTEVDIVDPIIDDETAGSVSGSYETYSEDKLARANSGDVVLFFHAPWCPSCRALDRGINASLSEIPTGLTILQTDYDSNIELRRKYGITYQHTLVQVDANGNMIKKWSGGSNLASIVSQVE